MKQSILSIIPARSGSKGIINKNLVLLSGKPLALWTIEASLSSKYITTTAVSSNDKKILSLAKSLGAKTIARPEYLSNDTCPSEPVIEHAIKHMEECNKSYDYIILLQPTSPIRETVHINDAIETIIAAKADALISVMEPPHCPLKSFFITKEGNLKGLLNDQYPFMRRQDLPQTYSANGAIYIVRTSCFMNNRSLFQGHTIPFLMSPEESIDIDTELDLIDASAALENRKIE